MQACLLSVLKFHRDRVGLIINKKSLLRVNNRQYESTFEREAVVIAELSNLDVSLLKKLTESMKKMESIAYLIGYQ